MVPYMNPALVVVILSLCFVACATEPDAPSPLQPVALIWNVGDTVVREVLTRKGGPVFKDTIVVDRNVEENGIVTTHWRILTTDVEIAEWIDRGLIMRSVRGTTIGIFGKLPTTRDEVIALDSFPIDQTDTAKGWSYQRLRTFTADTTITIPAGTFRCAGFSWSVIRSGVVISELLVWYAPGYGIIRSEGYERTTPTEPLELNDYIVMYEWKKR